MNRRSSLDAVGVIDNSASCWHILQHEGDAAGADANRLLGSRVPRVIPGSSHGFKYRLAYVVDEVCVVRYDNEVGKGDHRHVGETERAYRFSTPERSIADFQADIARWNDENGGA